METKPDYHITQPVQELIEERDQLASLNGAKDLQIEDLRAEALAWRKRAERPAQYCVTIETDDSALAQAVANFAAQQAAHMTLTIRTGVNPCVSPED